LHVVEVQAPRIIPPLDRYDVVAVQVPLPGELGSTQLVQHDLRRRHIDISEAAFPYYVRLPPTRSTAPVVALEANHPQTLVVFIVAAFDPAAATLVVPSLQRLLVHRAPRTAALSDGAATVFAAATLWKHRHDVDGHHALKACGAPTEA
jgi:hypothetical protein